MLFNGNLYKENFVDAMKYLRILKEEFRKSDVSAEIVSHVLSIGISKRREFLRAECRKAFVCRHISQ